MNNSGENLDFVLPYKDYLLKFIQLSQSDKLKVVQIGLKCFNTTNIQAQLWNNEEWEEKMNSLKVEIKKLREESRLKLLDKDRKIERIIQNNKEQNELFCDDIKKRAETKYKGEISELNSKLQYLQDKNESIYREVSNEYQEKKNNKTS